MPDSDERERRENLPKELIHVMSIAIPRNWFSFLGSAWQACRSGATIGRSNEEERIFRDDLLVGNLLRCDGESPSRQPCGTDSYISCQGRHEQPLQLLDHSSLTLICSARRRRIFIVWRAPLCPSHLFATVCVALDEISGTVFADLAFATGVSPYGPVWVASNRSPSYRHPALARGQWFGYRDLRE